MWLRGQKRETNLLYRSRAGVHRIFTFLSKYPNKYLYLKLMKFRKEM